MNTVTLVGRLTSDPETRTVNDKPVTTFRLAIDRTGTEGTDFVSIVCWNRTAEVAGAHLAKGRLVGVEGRLRHHEWTDKDTGERHERHDVVGRGGPVPRPAQAHRVVTGPPSGESPPPPRTDLRPVKRSGEGGRRYTQGGHQPVKPRPSPTAMDLCNRGARDPALSRLLWRLVLRYPDAPRVCPEARNRWRW